MDEKENLKKIYLSDLIKLFGRCDGSESVCSNILCNAAVLETFAKFGGRHL